MADKQKGEATEDEIDIDLEDPEVGNAAVKIQSQFRGHQARKEVQAKKDQITEEQKETPADEEIDIDLEDPEVGHAALKIQSQFRGHQARKEVQAKKDEIADQKDVATEDEIDIEGFFEIYLLNKSQQNLS